MSTTQQRIHDAVSAVSPIHGVSLGRLDDKATWRIDFKGEATDAEREAASRALNAVDIALIEKQEAAYLVESQSAMQRWQRDVIMAVLPPDHPQRAKALEAEAKIKELGIRATPKGEAA